MKLNKKIFSLAMIVPMSLSILAKPAFASDNLNNSDTGNETYSIMIEEENEDEYESDEVHADRVSIPPQLIEFVYKYLPVVNRYLSNKLNQPIIPLSEKIRILREYWDDFRQYFEEQTGKDADVEIDGVTHG